MYINTACVPIRRGGVYCCLNTVRVYSPKQQVEFRQTYMTFISREIRWNFKYAQIMQTCPLGHRIFRIGILHDLGWCGGNMDDNVVGEIIMIVIYIRRLNETQCEHHDEFNAFIFSYKLHMFTNSRSSNNNACSGSFLTRILYTNSTERKDSANNLYFHIQLFRKHLIVFARTLRNLRTFHLSYSNISGVI